MHKISTYLLGFLSFCMFASAQPEVEQRPIPFNTGTPIHDCSPFLAMAQGTTVPAIFLGNLHFLHSLSSLVAYDTQIMQVIWTHQTGTYNRPLSLITLDSMDAHPMQVVSVTSPAAINVVPTINSFNSETGESNWSYNLEKHWQGANVLAPIAHLDRMHFTIGLSQSHRAPELLTFNADGKLVRRMTFPANPHGDLNSYFFAGAIGPFNTATDIYQFVLTRMKDGRIYRISLAME